MQRGVHSNGTRRSLRGRPLLLGMGSPGGGVPCIAAGAVVHGVLSIVLDILANVEGLPGVLGPTDLAIRDLLGGSMEEPRGGGRPREELPVRKALR